MLHAKPESWSTNLFLMQPSLLCKSHFTLNPNTQKSGKYDTVNCNLSFENLLTNNNYQNDSCNHSHDNHHLGKNEKANLLEVNMK